MIQFPLHVFLLLISVTIVIGQSCPGNNTVWDSCAPAPACKNYCTKDPTEVCIDVCEPGCMCDTPGYKFLGFDSDDCIPEEQCPTCDTNEVYRVCATAYDDYCGKLIGINPPLPCMQGCFCREGYTRESDSPSAVCIPYSECPEA